MRYWIFGAGKHGRECCETYQNILDFRGFIDNDAGQNNRMCCGLTVITYSDFKTIFNKNDERIIISSKIYFTEMYTQLMNDGYEIYVEKIYNKIYGRAGKISAIENGWDKIINSTCGEELWLKAYFNKHYSADYKGTYVDAGAFHPFYASNTRWAYDAGWRGINIDANADCIKLFEKFRPEDININCGIADTAGELEFAVYNFLDRCTFNKKDFKDNGRLKLKEIRKVAVKTLNEILEENNIHDIDFLDIDVEGLDEKIVLSFDWKKYRPQCVLIEILGKNSIEEILETKIHEKMTAEGYRLTNYAVLTAMYVNNDFHTS